MSSSRSYEPNWFIGLPVPAQTWHASLPVAPDGVRLFLANDIHMTLLFFGNVPEAMARKAWQGVANAALSGFDVTLAGVQPMGSRQRFSALSFLLAEGAEVAIEMIQTVCRDAFAALGHTNAEVRKPFPHVTIARLRRNAGPDRRATAVAWADSISLRAGPLRLDRMALYTWADDRKQRQFKFAAERRLG